MSEFKPSEIKSPTEFQQFCEELLSAEYPDFQSVNDKTGDLGCDGKAKKGTIFFQFYLPDGTGSYAQRMAKIRKKINEDLGKLDLPFPKRWVFITPEKISPEIEENLRKRMREFGKMGIIVWSEPKMLELLAKHEHVNRSWAKKIHRLPYEVLPPESVTYGNRNNLPALVDLNRRMGLSLKDWDLTGKFDQIHTYSSDGKASVKLRPKSDEVNVLGKLQLRFDRSEEGEKKYQEFRAFQEKGGDFKVDERFIAAFDISAEGVNLFPAPKEIIKQEVLLRSVGLKRLVTRLDLLRNGIRLRRINGLELTIERAGTKEALLTNSHQKSNVLQVSILIDIVRKAANISLRFSFEEADAVDGYEHGLILRDFAKANKITLLFGEPKGQLTFMKEPVQQSFDDSVSLSEKLRDIQDAFEVPLGTVFDPSLDEEDFKTIVFLHNIIKTGRGRLSIPRMRFKVFRDANKEGLSSLIAGKLMETKTIMSSMTAALFDKELDLGEITAFSIARLSEESRERLGSAMKSGRIEDTQVEFVSNEPAELFFHQWHRDVERAIARFQADRKLTHDSLTRD